MQMVNYTHTIDFLKRNFRQLSTLDHGCVSERLHVVISHYSAEES